VTPCTLARSTPQAVVVKKGSPTTEDAVDYSEMSRVADRLLTPVAVIAPDSTLRYANGEVAKLVDLALPELVGQRLLELVHPEDRERAARELAKIATKDSTGGFSRLRLRGHEGQGWRLIDIYAHNLMDDPSVRGILVSGGDITEQESLARALRALSDVTRILVHAKEERSLMSAVCDSIIENGEYLVAWVGYAEHDDDTSVRLVASSGLTTALSTEPTRWDDSDLGRGPTGEAIRTGQIQVVREPQESRPSESWREQWGGDGVRSVCSLPLLVEGKVLGALTIYGRDLADFNPRELAILAEYAGELSFGIDRLRDANRLLRNESQLREAERLTHMGHWEWDLGTGRLEFMADEIYAIYGTDLRQWRGSMEAFLEPVPPEEKALVRAALERTLTAGSAELTHRIKRGADDVRYLRMRTEVVTDGDGAPVRILGTSVDITDAMLAQQQLESSREFLLTITDNMTEGMIATDAQGAITFINAAASRLIKVDASEILGSPATKVFQLSPQNGASADDDLPHLHDVWAQSKTLHVEYGSVICRDGSSVPIALTASPLAAEGYEGSVLVFEDISTTVAEQLRVERELDTLAWVGRIRDALDDGRLELFAQPVIDLTTQDVIQHELLVRMRSASGELFEPAQFLPTAEEFGLVTEIDRWVIDETARLAARGHRVAFNLSARSVVDPHTLGRIRDAIGAAGALAQNVECEITETALVNDVTAAESLVRGLMELGCTVALDDFGVGYGGFAYLKRLPVSVLKIDREFVRDLDHEASSRHVVAAVVSLAKAFGMTTTAEGPESNETLDLLRELGVDHAQGFIIGPPSPLIEAFGDVRRPRDETSGGHEGASQG
jgi:PAS domain S-box-containing protein